MTAISSATTVWARRARHHAPVATVGALSLLVAGCSIDGDPTGGGTAPFVYLSSTDVITEWDPAQAYSNEALALPNLYETLTRYNPDTEEAEPLLAEDWEVSEDGETWTFDLAEDVTFHSGEPMTAESVQAAIERTMELDLGAAYLWDPVSSIEATDEHTVVFDLDYPAALDLIAAANYAAFIYEIPEGAPEGPDAEDSPFEAESHGTGPYTVAEWNPGSERELQLTAFEDYWRGWEDDQIEEIEYQVVSQPETVAQMMEGGEADFAQNLPVQLIDQLRETEDVDVIETPSWQNLFGLINTEVEPLDDPQVREAIAHGVNYDEIIEATQGAFEPSDGVIPEGLLGHNTDLDIPNYDPDRAEELLADAGYGEENGEILTLELTYTEGEEDLGTIAELMQDHLSSLNIELQIEALPWESGHWPRAQEEDPEDRQDITLMYWWPDDPQALSWFYNMFMSEDDIVFNLAYYSNPELDELIEEVGPLAATDEEAAEDTYDQMQQILIEDNPALFLGTTVYQRALRSEYEGYVDNPLYPNAVFAYELTRG
ncbi:ABC transporter substrate-binding protein [Lipingzhangella sp. LS1_29]|uniref:ABC transporter substrate-binding protein n=1 Tax=Lipingzhangella rawalii TaxID=2055835 RepID=A0ABU2H7S8_9ACTN|nr:ABC transporter substrate-binding protein [Lipingzhangella rawalii]MDS1271363.1 ABC transporter substrate-binding protein [Lipingzhangella rawalii]